MVRSKFLLLKSPGLWKLCIEAGVGWSATDAKKSSKIRTTHGREVTSEYCGGVIGSVRIRQEQVFCEGWMRGKGGASLKQMLLLKMPTCLESERKSPIEKVK